MALKSLLEQEQTISKVVEKSVIPVDNDVDFSEDAVEKKLWRFWNELIETAAATPHANQEPLVDFIHQLRKEPGPKKRNGESFKIWGSSLEWKNLTLLGPALREAWNNIPLNSEACEKVEKWVNMNAFVARLTSTSAPSDPLDFSLYGVWAMRAALEDHNPESKMPSLHSIETAAVWAIYASRAMWQRSVAEHIYEGKVAREGTTLKGKEWKGCSKERWGLWEERLVLVWERFEEGSIKGLVRRASQEMAKVERE